MTCPICEKRKGKRYCPAKGATICTICCGTEREVTIDCPRDCPYLIEAHRHEISTQKVDPERVPFKDARISRDFVREHTPLLVALYTAIAGHANSNSLVADPDVSAGTEKLAEAYQTLSRGIYYENPPDHAVERGVYEALKAAIERFKKEQQERSFTSVRDSEIRDALIFAAQMAALNSNGRPKSRAYINYLREQFKAELPQEAAAGSLIIP